MNMSVNIAGVELKNPVMTASGTFGSGKEYSEFVDLNKLGAVVTKGVANVPWPGNPTPRVAEVYGGMLNAIGLQNPGVDVFAQRDIPFLKQYDTKIIVNVCGKTFEDYLAVVERLGDEPVDMLEINVSCPNVKEGAIAFGQKADCLYALFKSCQALLNLLDIVVYLCYPMRYFEICCINSLVNLVADDAVVLYSISNGCIQCFCHLFLGLFQLLLLCSHRIRKFLVGDNIVCKSIELGCEHSNLVVAACD